MTYGEFTEVVGRNIIQIRNSKNITQKELAELTGISVPTLCQYEKGKRCLKLYSADLIAGALGVTIGELIYG